MLQNYEKVSFNKNSKDLKFLAKDKRFKEPNHLNEITEIEPVKTRDVSRNPKSMPLNKLG